MIAITGLESNLERYRENNTSYTTLTVNYIIDINDNDK